MSVVIAIKDDPNRNDNIPLPACDHVTQLLNDIMQAKGLKGQINKLIECFNSVSYHTYEANTANGCILLCMPDTPSVHQLILLKEPVAIIAIQNVRKLIEVSSPKLNLLCDGETIYGFGWVDSKNREQTCVINFEERGSWKLFYNEHKLIITDSCQITLAGLKVDEQLLKQSLKEIFADISEQSQNHIWELYKAASEQSRGTNLLITDNADTEVLRLKNQSTLVTPFLLTPDIIRHITKIDGTVVFDRNGICYAIGAILDGNASINGDKARGGRYNSAVMYYESSSHPCLIIVISQDGLIDFVPAPRGLS